VADNARNGLVGERDDSLLDEKRNSRFFGFEPPLDFNLIRSELSDSADVPVAQQSFSMMKT
jgi:hypothetical protein